MGGRRTKLLAPSAPVQRVDLPTDPLDRVQSHLMRTLALVEEANARGEATPAVVRESANVARALINLSGERRAQAKAERQAREGLDKASVVAWFRELGASEQARFVRELQQVVNRGSGLA